MKNNIHFFTKGSFSVPSSRYRAFMIASCLNEIQGINTYCHEPVTKGSVAFKSISGLKQEYNELRNIQKQFQEVGSGDIIYCQRPVYKRLRAAYLLARGEMNPLFFDFDDAVFLHHPDLTRWFVKRADVVVAGNTFLQRYAEYYNDTAYRLPTAIPFEKYKTATYDADREKPFRVGWVGNANAHRKNLEMFADILEGTENKRDDKIIHLIGVRDAPDIKQRFREIPGFEAEFTDWIKSEEYAERIPDIIASFDVGVMPLTDSFWNRGKSALKLLEYMACGVPVIASPVGENAYIINSGKNGYLANSTDEWVTAFNELRNKAIRTEMSKAARRTVREEYTLSSVSNQLLKIIQTEIYEE